MEAKRTALLPFLLALIGLMLALSAGKSAANAGTQPPINSERLHPVLRRALMDPTSSAQAACPGDQACTAEVERTADGFLRIIVEWRREPSVAAQASAAPDRRTQRQQVVAFLQADAQRNSLALQTTLQEAQAQGLARDVRAFWASPVITLEARSELIEALSQRADVVLIRPDQKLYLDQTTFEFVPPSQAASDLPWDLEMLDVGLAQRGLGLDGTGVVIASLDTGVDWQHPALLTKYRGYRGKNPAVHYGNWHVSTNEPYFYPGDGYGHGTHTMGTMVGDDGEGHRIGVAPGARWISVKVFANAGYTYESWLHDAFQWVMAPEGDPGLAPDVVNNSWGSEVSADELFRPDVAALRAAGILPIFSAGNEGPGSGSVGNPASYPESFAVGSVDNERTVARSSGRGPSPWKEIKPEVVAPGANVISAFPGGGYRMSSGTSMAAPHVTGLAALLLQADPDLMPDQLEALLKTTASPPGTVVPNNVYGWGLVNAYAAGLRVTASGEIIGRVVRTDGGGIAQPVLTATPSDAGASVTVSGDTAGAFSIALRPARYDVTARAFGFEPASLHSVEVAAGARTPITLTLITQPVGSLFGRVTDLQTDTPLSATVTVEDTPARTRTDPKTGLYSFALPAGSYTATITAEAHRVGHIRATVSAGAGQMLDAALPQAPRLLLVDSGRWYYDSHIHYFEDALEALDYPFTLWPIRDPFGENTGHADRPSKEDLKRYDVVIWSSPSDSPGLIEASQAITSYLASGGQMLVSGQDVAFWDGGGSTDNRTSPYFTNDLGLRFAGEGNMTALAGVPGTTFAGLTVAPNTADSAGNQFTPDAVTIDNHLLAEPALRWSNGAIGAATAGTCRPYRAAWLGAGLEGVGPRTARIDALDRVLNWFEAAPAAYGLAASSASGPRIAPPGTTVTQTIRLNSIGVNTDTIKLLLSGGPWTIDVSLADGRRLGNEAVFTLGACSTVTLTASITVPLDQPRDARSVHTLHLVSQSDPQSTATVTVTAKTPAPVLFVDRELWSNYHTRYETTLNALDLPYDYFDTQGGNVTPLTDTLKLYPLVLWATGYNWARPLDANDEQRLSSFLDNGGRLLVTSQDLLDVREHSDFVRTRLGVVDAALTITPTEVLGLPGNPLGSNLGPWRLVFPFRNWGDGMTPGPQARGVLQDQHLSIIGVTRSAATWRTAFFSFPLETLDDAARQALLGRTLVWLSPLGESRLEAPVTAAEGSRIPITLTLGLATSAPRADLRAIVPLLPETSLVPGSLRGPWAYDPVSSALAWAGALDPGITLTLGADLSLSRGITDGASLPLRARLYAGDGITITAEAPIHADAPWLTLVEQVAPTESVPGGTVQYTITVANAGVLSSTAHLTDTLPAGLSLKAGSAWAAQGDLKVNENTLTWSGALAPGAETMIGYSAMVTLPRPGARLTNWIELTDDFGRRTVGWTAVRVPAWIRFPIIRRQEP